MKHWMIADMQFGSTGKGLLAGWLASRHFPDVSVAAWGPNAGHTYIDRYDKKTITTMIPIGARWSKATLIGPGAVINPEAFLEEASALPEYAKIFIHPNAAVVTAADLVAEKELNSIGSTQKGTAEAAIAKMRRRPRFGSRALPIFKDFAASNPELNRYVIDHDDYNGIIDTAATIQIEAAQGHSLSINGRFYPYATSRDTSPNQVLADCGIPYSIRPRVFGCMRTFPIRVANRYDFEGKQVGTSGPCYPDQFELQWKQLGMEPELTTVTKLPRRIFTFSVRQIDEAQRMMGVHSTFINFMNYLNLPRRLQYKFVESIEALGINVAWLGWGPKDGDVAIRANFSYDKDD